MKRSDFLKYIGLSGLACIWSSYNVPYPRVHKGKVIVIGAGMAGITAARKLQNNGYEVVVLEARDRIGGRIFTNDTLGTPLDFGASWIHGPSGNPITHLTNEYKITTKETDFTNTYLYDQNGRSLSDNRISEIFDEGTWLVKKAGKWANRQDVDTSVGQGLDHMLRREGVYEDPESMRLFNWFRTTMELDAGTDYDKVSTWYGSDAGFPGEDRLFPNGYGQLVQSMAQSLDIRTRHEVKEVEYTDSKVKTTTAKEVFEGDIAIITVPLGVLKKGSIQFNPPLPAFKNDAIHKQLDMGLLNKIAMRFDSSFWPKDRDFLGHASGTKGHFSILLNWAYYTGKPYLIAFLVGDYAREYEKRSNTDVVNDVNKLVHRLFPKGENVREIARSRWASDPYAYGSYSYIPTGGGKDGADALARPHKALLFAGEATYYKYNATVHGAHLSGLREADRIIQ